MTARPLTSTISSVSGTPAGWYNVKDYGAVGNGTTDDSSAIQSAVNAAKTSGGTVYFPPGDYKVATTLDCSTTGATHPFAMRGPQCGKHYRAQSARLVYSGTTTGANGGLMYFNGLSGFEVAYLGLDYSNASFTGDVVTVDGRGPGVFADCADWHFHHCGSWARTSITARSIIRFSYAIVGTVTDCHFQGAVNAIRLGDPGVGFVVAVGVERCQFDNNTDAHILIGTADAETVVIRDNVFEAGVNTTAIRGASTAVDGADCALYSPVIAGNWFGDASGVTQWIKGLQITSNNFIGTLGPGNFFGDPGGGTGKCFTAGGSWNIVGNSFGGGIALGDPGVATRFNLHGNFFNGTVTDISNYVPNAMSGNVVTTDTTFPIEYNMVKSRFAIGGPLGRNIDPAEAWEYVVISAAGSLTAQGGAAAIYRLESGGTPVATVVQAPSSPSGDIREVQLVAGATPTANVRVTKAGLGFYGTAPVAQASRAGQLTDSTGGSVSSTLAAGITDSVAKNAIASLAAKVNALETIIHNLGLSA